MHAVHWPKLIAPLRKAWGLMLDGRVSIWVKLIPIIAVIYVLSPLDIIPDVIIGLGQLDDIGIFLFALYIFFRLVPKDVLDKHTVGERNGSKEKMDRKKGEVVEEGEFEEI